MISIICVLISVSALYAAAVLAKRQSQVRLIRQRHNR